MKRKTVTRSLTRRRRRNRLRKLKTAALTLGLATAWGGSGADAATLSSTATVTLSLTDAAAFSITDGNGASATATATITVEGINDSTQGGANGLPLISEVPFDVASDYFFVGVSGPDLVLSFPNGGAAAIGEFWGSLFIDPVRGGVTEGEILQQLAGGSFGVGEQLEPGSPLGRLIEGYGDLLRTPYGKESTLVAFTNNTAGPNHGELAGTFRQSIVPEPMSLGLVISATGLVLGVRRRD